jgi:hypothetical protein
MERSYGDVASAKRLTGLKIQLFLLINPYVNDLFFNICL